MSLSYPGVLWAASFVCHLVARIPAWPHMQTRRILLYTAIDLGNVPHSCTIPEQARADKAALLSEDILTIRPLFPSSSTFYNDFHLSLEDRVNLCLTLSKGPYTPVPTWPPVLKSSAHQTSLHMGDWTRLLYPVPFPSVDVSGLNDIVDSAGYLQFNPIHCDMPRSLFWPSKHVYILICAPPSSLSYPKLPRDISTNLRSNLSWKPLPCNCRRKSSLSSRVDRLSGAPILSITKYTIKIWCPFITLRHILTDVAEFVS